MSPLRSSEVWGHPHSYDARRWVAPERFLSALLRAWIKSWVLRQQYGPSPCLDGRFSHILWALAALKRPVLQNNLAPIRVRGRNIARSYRKIDISGQSRPSLSIRSEKQASRRSAQAQPRCAGAGSLDLRNTGRSVCGWRQCCRFIGSIRLAEMAPYCCQSRFRKMRQNCPIKGEKWGFFTENATLPDMA